MEENFNANPKYESCISYKRKQPVSNVDQAIIDNFSNDFRVLPLFEKKLHDHTRVRHYSLKNNELLACRWTCYVDTPLVRTPFVFPRVEDYHFYKYHTRYEPSQSLSNMVEHRRRLGLGHR